MKKKILTAIGALFCLAILFSACGDDKSSAPSDPREDPEITTPDSTLSSSEGSVPTSSAVPASSEDAIPQSSESLESSSSNVFLPFSSSWYDGNNLSRSLLCGYNLHRRR